MFNFSILKVSLFFDPFEQFETNEDYSFVSEFYINISKQLKFWYENNHWFNIWNDSKAIINITAYIQTEDQLKILHFYTAWIQLYSNAFGLVPDVFSGFFLRDYFIYYMFLIIFISLTSYMIPIISTNSMSYLTSAFLVQYESVKFLVEVIRDISLEIMKYFPYFITTFSFIFFFILVLFMDSSSRAGPTRWYIPIRRRTRAQQKARRKPREYYEWLRKMKRLDKKGPNGPKDEDEKDEDEDPKNKEEPKRKKDKTEQDTDCNCETETFFSESSADSQKNPLDKKDIKPKIPALAAFSIYICTITVIKILFGI